MGKHYDFSIIAPCYNGEQYIPSFIKYFKKINFLNYNIELVIVNDGSTDNSLEYLKKIKTDNLFDYKLVNQEHMGTFLTRYNGVLSCSGDYVIFIDIDDMFLPNIFVELKKIHFSLYDCVRFNYETIKYDGEIMPSFIDYRYSGKCMSGNSDFLFPQDDGRYTVNFKVYRRLVFPVLVDVSRYEDSCYFEDSAFNAMVVANCKNVYVLDKVLYKYLMHKNSACTTNIKNYKLFNERPVVDALLLYPENSYAFSFLQRQYYDLLLNKIYYLSLCKLQLSKKLKAFNVMRKTHKNEMIVKDKRDVKIISKSRSKRFLYYAFMLKLYFIIIWMSKFHFRFKKVRLS